MRDIRKTLALLLAGILVLTAALFCAGAPAYASELDTEPAIETDADPEPDPDPDPDPEPDPEPEDAIDIAEAAITVARQLYTGEALEPEITVTLNDVMLVPDVDYTVEYADNIEVGTATVTVTGIGAYTGTASATFAIVKPGWAQIDGRWYYIENDGSLRTNAWMKPKGTYIYLGADGAVVTNGWARYGSAYYYMDANGSAVKNRWVQYEGAWYYFGSDCKLLFNSWVLYKDKYYYVGNNARMVASQWITYDSKYYYFGSNGQCLCRGDYARKVINACKTTPSTGNGMCAAWVTYVFMNAGIGQWNGNACEMYDMYCTSPNYADLKPGMIIAVPSSPTSYLGRIYGHVGIYIGDGKVCHNYLGTITTWSLTQWLKTYSALSTPKWGWLGGVYLF